MKNKLKQIRELGVGLWVAEEADRTLRDKILPKMRKRFETKCRKHGGYYTGTYELGEPEMRRYMFFFKKAWYPFFNDPNDPLTFHLPDGTRIRPQSRFWTDFGSTPALLQLIFPKEEFARPYIIHDSAYDTHSLLMALPGQDEFVDTPVTWSQADKWLRLGIEIEGGMEIKEWLIWMSVHSPIGLIAWLT